MFDDHAIFEAMSSQKIYDFKDDREMILRMQQSSKQGNRKLLQKKHGLVGSKKWWENIEPLKKQSVGIVDEIFNAGHNDLSMMKWNNGNEVHEFILEGKPSNYKIGDALKMVWIDRSEVSTSNYGSSMFLLEIHKELD